MERRGEHVACLVGLLVIAVVLGGCMSAGPPASSGSASSTFSPVRSEFPYRINQEEVTGFWIGPAQIAPKLSDVLPAPDSDVLPLISAYNESVLSDWRLHSELRSLPLVAILETKQRKVRIQIAPEFPADIASIAVSGANDTQDSRVLSVKSRELVLQMLRLADTRLSSIEKIVVDPDHEWFK